MTKEVHKKIAELKSLWGDGGPVYSKYRPIELFCLFISRWHYRLTKGLYYKVKYFFQRHTRGFDDLDKWNAAWYIARKAIPVLTAMRNSFHGTSIKWHREDRFGNITELTREEVFHDDEIPPAFTENEWCEIIDDIIFAFQYTLDLDLTYPENNFSEDIQLKREKRFKRGMKLFSIYYQNLWD